MILHAYADDDGKVVLSPHSELHEVAASGEWVMSKHAITVEEYA